MLEMRRSALLDSELRVVLSILDADMLEEGVGGKTDIEGDESASVES